MRATGSAEGARGVEFEVGTMVIGLLSAIASFTAVLWIPGYLLSRLFVPDAHSTERLAVTQICSFTIAPLTYFLIAVAVGIPLDKPLLWILSTALSMICAVILQQKNRSGSGAPLHALGVSLTDLVQHAVLVLACTLFVLFALRALDGGDVFSTLQHCLYVIVMHTISNDPSAAVPLYDHLSGDTVHVLVHHTRDAFNGLAPLFHEQRLGNAAIMAPHVSLLGSAGWYTVVIHASVVTALCSFTTARYLKVSRGVAAVSSGLLLLATHNLCAYTVNENMFAVAIVSFLLWFSLRKDLNTSHVVLMGLVLGHLIGVRHTSSLFWPATLIAIMWNSGGIKRAMIALACGLLAAVPWLYVNFLMLGHPLAHPKVIADSDGRVVQNTWLGFQFTFKALNYPFTDTAVRTAWHPFPTFIWLPLMMAWSFGQVAFATALYGLRSTLIPRRTLAILLLFLLPHNIAMAWLELLDWEQISYAAPGFVPLGTFLALGLQQVRAAKQAQVLQWAAVVLFVIISSIAVRGIEFPVDMRGLDATHWPEEPAADRGVNALGKELTRFRPLPRIPVMRSIVFEQFTGSLTGDNHTTAIPNAPSTYASGRVGILTGYAETAPRTYDFEVIGSLRRDRDTPVRTGVSLHTVTLQLKATRIQVKVTRSKGAYSVDVAALEPSNTLQDFTFWINPWRPWAKSISVTKKGAPLPGMRILRYGGQEEDGEALLIATNYPEDIVGTREIQLTVDTGEEEVHCGWLLFGHQNHDMNRIETLVLAGGHVLFWHGETELKLTVPNSIWARNLVLFSEPYCSSHVPQYGDRYGTIRLDSNATEARLSIDRMWMP